MNEPAPKTNLYGKNPHPFQYDGAVTMRTFLDMILITILFTVVFTFAFVNVAESIDDIIIEQSQTPPDPQELRDWNQGVDDYALELGIFFGFLVGFIALLSLAIESGIAWFIGNLMDGQGEFYQFLRAVMFFNYVMIFVVLLFFLGAFWLVEMTGLWMRGFYLFSSASTAISILIYGARGLVIMRAHQISYFRAFITAFTAGITNSMISGILWVCVYFAIIIVVWSALPTI